MENRTDITKRMTAGNISLLAALVALTGALWNEYSWYEAVAPYGTLISFIFLAVTFLCYVPVKEAVRDPFFYLMGAASVIAAVNLIVIGSGKGAWLTATDVLIVIYLSGKVRFSELMTGFACAYTGFYFLLSRRIRPFL